MNTDIEAASKLLESNINVDNVVVMVRGCDWFWNNIFLPVVTIEQTDHCISQRQTLTVAYSILGDISLLLRGYETANSWYRKYLLCENNDVDVLHDIAYTYEMFGDYANAQKYYRKYFDNDDYELTESLNDHVDMQIQQAYSKLVLHQPAWVIDNCSCTVDQNELYRIVTMAYFTFGQAAQIEVLTRVEKYFIFAVNPTIDEVDLFYAADYFVEIPTFWRLILKYKPSIVIIDCDLKLFTSDESGFDNSIIFDIIQLHIFRTENDIVSMRQLQKTNSSWKSPCICIDFHNAHKRMPNWHELYEHELHANDTLTNM
jgi:tetratricopeptide (TPR) repeat protein